MQTEWEKANKWESDWWGNCLDTVKEEIKQKTYAKKMGLFSLDLKGRSVLDIGGGPVSLLLKCRNKGFCAVIDPLIVPEWVVHRYEENSIAFINVKAEFMDEFITIKNYDEVWIYNCLQHVENPESVINKALKFSKIVRVFEWLDMPKDAGHIHILTASNLNKWFGGIGKTEALNENGCHGVSYYGVFKGEYYE